MIKSIALKRWDLHNKHMIITAFVSPKQLSEGERFGLF